MALQLSKQFAKSGSREHKPGNLNELAILVGGVPGLTQRVNLRHWTGLVWDLRQSIQPYRSTHSHTCLNPNSSRSSSFPAASQGCCSRTTMRHDTSCPPQRAEHEIEVPFPQPHTSSADLGTGLAAARVPAIGVQVQARCAVLPGAGQLRGLPDQRIDVHLLGQHERQHDAQDEQQWHKPQHPGDASPCQGRGFSNVVMRGNSREHRRVELVCLPALNLARSSSKLRRCQPKELRLHVKRPGQHQRPRRVIRGDRHEPAVAAPSERARLEVAAPYADRLGVAHHDLRRLL